MYFYTCYKKYIVFVSVLFIVFIVLSIYSSGYFQSSKSSIPNVLTSFLTFLDIFHDIFSVVRGLQFLLSFAV